MVEHEQELVALGQRLEREKRGISTGELAGAAGVERGRLDAIEGGRLYLDTMAYCECWPTGSASSLS